MNRIFLSLIFVGAVFFANAQDPIVSIISPSNMAQNFEHTFAPGPDVSGITDPWPLIPNMEDPANRVVAPVVIARAEAGSTDPDSLLCQATTMDLTGKIAMVYRGVCSFGTKAKFAFDAGAAAVLVIGSTDEMFTMLGNPDAATIDIPVAYIKQSDGAIINNGLTQGETITMLIGNKIGYLPNDLGSIPGYTATVPAQAPVEIANNTTEFPIVFAAQVYNYGANEATNIRVIADINKDGSLLYSDTSSTVSTLLSGDSTDQFTFTNYIGDLGVGNYEIIYTIVSDSTDESAADNVFTYPFRINGDKIFSLARYDNGKSFTHNSGNYRAANQADPSFASCISFQDPNASRIGILGVYFQASVTNDADGNPQAIDGEEILITVEKWNDVFSFDSPSWEDLVPVTGGSYIYPEDYVDTFMYADMDEYILLEDDVRYLICSRTSNADVYLGYDSERKYDFYQSIVERYLSPFQAGSQWGVGFIGMPVASLTLKLFTADEVGLANASKLIDAKVYPNPAKDVVNIVVNNYEGAATLTVTDLSGKVVVSNDVTIQANGAVTVNTSEFATGMYLVKMQLANGNEVNASVVVE